MLNAYAVDVGPRLKRPAELAQRLAALLGAWGDQTLAAVNGPACRAYAAARASPAMARRELEDLRAAINHHRKEGLCDAEVGVWLPPKSSPRERWLSVAEAAKLVRAAWRYREVQKGRPTGRHSRRHVARFILVALYTGSRSGAICGAALVRTEGRGFVDLERGLFYRKAQGAEATNKRQPTIRLPPRLLAHVRRWARLGLAKNSVVEYAGAGVKSVRKAFTATAKAAGLAGVTPHVLRHTAVTWAAQGGVNMHEALGFFGLTAETWERHYAHHHPDHQAGVAKALTRRGREGEG